MNFARSARFCVQNGILVAGGYSQYAESSCEFFNSAQCQWSTVAPLNTARYYASAMTHADKVYVFGGEVSYRIFVEDIEQYDYAANKWTVLQVRLTVARSESAAVCVCGRIFIVCGCNGDSRNAQSAVECFDPVENRFSSVSPLSQARWGSAAASVRVSAIVLKRLYKSANAP